MAMVRDKYRIRFRKTRNLRFISHHDLMRCFERILRRAQIPFHSTSGFNPKPRLIFAAPLALGLVGQDEVADLELDQPLAADEVQARLTREAPAGLEILSVSRIDGRSTAHVRQVCYRAPLVGVNHEGIEQRITNLLTASECWIERRRPETRRLNIRPFIAALRLVPEALELDLLVTPHGTARPDEVLQLLGLESVLADGATLERTRVELEEEESHEEGNAH
jgi:radical SAM-linked protein